MADWSRVETDLEWCLVRGGIRVEGRAVLYQALAMTDPAAARRGLRNGFLMSIRDEDGLANFAACEREDGPRLFNLARHVIGLPAVAAPPPG